MSARPDGFQGVSFGQENLAKGGIDRGFPVEHRHSGIALRVGVDEQKALPLA